MVDEPTQAPVNEADRLAQLARPSYRRYAGSLAVFAAGAFLASVTYGVLASPVGTVLSLVLWAGGLATALVQFRRARADLQRFGLLHGMVIVTWAGLWIISVAFGSMFFGDNPAWWFGAGIACAVPALLAAIAVFRASR